MKDKNIFKFVVNDVEYPSLLRYNLEAIKDIIGPFVVVRVKQHPLLFTKMTIWCKRKGE